MVNQSSPADLDVTAQAVRMLTLYSLAEVQSGHASTIRVSAEGASFSVADDGRGHSVERTVLGLPYLPFIYTHLAYPFGNSEGGPVQLHGLGLSLLNVLCSDLKITVNKENQTLRMTYRSGHLCGEERACPTGFKGNEVSGTVHSRLQPYATNSRRIEQWLMVVLACTPALRLHFNGRELRTPPQGAA